MTAHMGIFASRGQVQRFIDQLHEVVFGVQV
jgi:hypothetical protein